MQNLPPGLALSIHVFVTGASDAHAQGNAEIEDDPEALDDDTTSSSEIEKGDDGNVTKKDDEKSGEGSSSNNANGVLSLPMVKIHEGRADLDKLIKDEVMLGKDVMSVNGASMGFSCEVKHIHWLCDSLRHARASWRSSKGNPVSSNDRHPERWSDNFTARRGFWKQCEL